MTVHRKTLISLLLMLAVILSLGSLGVFAAESEIEAGQSESAPAETIPAEEPGEAGPEAIPEETEQPEPETAPEPEPETAPEPEPETAPEPEPEAESAEPEMPMDGEPGSCEVQFFAYDADTKTYTLTLGVSVDEGKKLADIPDFVMPEGSGWYCEDPADPEAAPVLYESAADVQALTITKSLNFTVACKVSYLDYEDNGTVYGTEYVMAGKYPAGIEMPEGVTNWINASNGIVYVPKQMITADTNFYSWVSPGLTTVHVAYINGTSEYRFSPSNNLTRAQAANILYNLLADKSAGPFTASFTDVPEGAWYAEAVNTLASRGIITGRTATTFEPNAPILRGEFVLMISRLFELTTAEWTFKDGKESDYFRDAVAVASANGWINGYSDGTFKGRAHITRAEAVTVINRVLGRTPDEAEKARIDALGHRKFVDVDDNTNWAYYQIMEAAINADGKLPAFTKLTKGMQTIGGKLYYVDETLSFKVFSPGLRTIGSKKYYVNASVDVAGFTKYSGVCKFPNGKSYMIKSDGSVQTGLSSGYETRVVEHGGYMYYIKTDGSLLCNGYYGALYFGKTGAYTSGDKTLDSLTYSLLKDIIAGKSYTAKYKVDSSGTKTVKASTQREKLFAAYCAVRDHCVAYKRFAHESEWSYAYAASIFLQHGKGDCAGFGAAMVYAARRIGYDCRVGEGKLATGARHSWEVIYFPGGTTKMMDVEQEWGYIAGYYGYGGVYFDCYLMDYKPGSAVKYGTRYGTPQQNVWAPYYPN